MADYNKELSKVRGPFRDYPKKKKEEPISTLDDYQKAFIKGLETYDVRQKKVGLYHPKVLLLLSHPHHL